MIKKFNLAPRLALLTGAVMLVAFAGNAQATTYTSSADFAAATTALTVENYASSTAGTLIANGDTLDGLTYSFATASGLGGVITNLYNSFSGNSLAAKQVAGPLAMPDFFYANESFTVNFATPVTAVGIFSNINLPDTASITTSAGTATTTVTAYDTHTFGFLGFTSATPFTSATFQSSNFNIPEIEYQAVPEPSSWAMMLAGIGLIGFALRRHPLRRPRAGFMPV